jgi:hypothetical protein
MIAYGSPVLIDAVRQEPLRRHGDNRLILAGCAA